VIADVLFKRYPDRWIHAIDRVPAELATLIRQAALVVYDDVAPRLPSRARLFEGPEKQLARELGAMGLASGPTAEQNCMQFLGEQYGLWNDAHRSPDEFFKLRLSLIELLFREAESILRGLSPRGDVKGWWSLLQKRQQPPTKSAMEQALEAVMLGIEELNERFRSANLPVEYHNGIIQRVDDRLTSQQIEAPFWVVVADPIWKNVDADMKEAIDRRDAGKSDASFHALKALESTLRILSEELGRTRGVEKGAGDYIDNLVAPKSERFIAVWESESLKGLFRDLRNPMGHGPGNTPPLSLTPQQSTFVIELAMSWIKSLVNRMP
jgi:hypothetical protein